MKKDVFIANGRRFSSYEDVERYARENGLRIANTEIIRKGVHLITLNSK